MQNTLVLEGISSRTISLIYGNLRGDRFLLALTYQLNQFSCVRGLLFELINGNVCSAKFEFNAFFDENTLKKRLHTS